MTMKDILGQIGFGATTPIDRQHHHFSGHQHFSGPSGEGGYYGPPPDPAYNHPAHVSPAYHSEPTYEVEHYSNDGHKSKAAMSALTLLAFLFFLNILQQCLKDHIASMTPPQITIMTAGREGFKVAKDTQDEDKIDKIGTADSANTTLKVNRGSNVAPLNSMPKYKNNIEEKGETVSIEGDNLKNEHTVTEKIHYDEAVESQMEKIYIKNKFPSSKFDYHDIYHESREDGFPGFVSAMTEEESYSQS